MTIFAVVGVITNNEHKQQAKVVTLMSHSLLVIASTQPPCN